VSGADALWREHFRDAVVVVAGGSTGIGAASASAFARAGARVTVADVADAPGEALAADLRAKGLNCEFRHCAVDDDAQVDALVADVVARHGRLDVVHANAGVEWTKDVRHTSRAEWDRVLAINLTGVFLVTRAALRVMCDARAGAIVVTGSPHAEATVPDAGAYAASKGGVHALVRAMAMEGAPYGVRVNAVVPGTIDTPLVRREAQAAADPEAQMELMARSQPLGRLGQPDEVAQVALFLASPLAGFVTGSLYPVDGGLVAGLPAGPPLAYNN
jgi:NAD(P)-dependent dehydrogenase (short-subunit alcohol dehydrogenase family)